MWTYFDETGELLEPALMHGNEPRVGTTAFEIFAYFQGLDLDFFDTATIRLKKPDLQQTEYPTMYMYKKTKKFIRTEEDSNSTLFQDQQEYVGYSFNFAKFAGDQDISVLLDTPGNWRATITLYNSNELRSVQGIITFNVQRAVSSVDYPNEAEISDLEIAENIAGLYLPKVTNVWMRGGQNFITKATNYQLNAALYSVGSFVYDETSNCLYRITRILESPADINLVGAEYTLVFDFSLTNLADVAIMLADFAPEYNSSVGHSKGEIVMHEKQMYRCKEKIIQPETFNASKWYQVTVASLDHEKLRKDMMMITYNKTVADLFDYIHSYQPVCIFLTGGSFTENYFLGHMSYNSGTNKYSGFFYEIGTSYIVTFSEVAAATGLNTIFDNNSANRIEFQRRLTFDTTPALASNNPITSGGVYTALLDKVNWYSIYNDNQTINNLKTNTNTQSKAFVVEFGYSGSANYTNYLCWFKKTQTGYNTYAYYLWFVDLQNCKTYNINADDYGSQTLYNTFISKTNCTKRSGLYRHDVEIKLSTSNYPNYFIRTSVISSRASVYTSWSEIYNVLGNKVMSFGASAEQYIATYIHNATLTTFMRDNTVETVTSTISLTDTVTEI